jgi:hypothetical protein
VVEVNSNALLANGKCYVYVSQVAALAESEEPILKVEMPAIGTVQQAIGSYVAHLIEDGILSLVESGAVDCSRKTLMRCNIVGTFVLGPK